MSRQTKSSRKGCKILPPLKSLNTLRSRGERGGADKWREEGAELWWSVRGPETAQRRRHAPNYSGLGFGGGTKRRRRRDVGSGERECTSQNICGANIWVNAVRAILPHPTSNMKARTMAIKSRMATLLEWSFSQNHYNNNYYGDRGDMTSLRELL